MIGIFTSPSGQHRGVLFGASQLDIREKVRFSPLYPTSVRLCTARSFGELERDGEMTRDTPILMVRYSLELINGDAAWTIRDEMNEPRPDSHYEAFGSFKECLLNVLATTPPTLPPNKPYSCLETIWEYLHKKYIRLLQYERAFDNLFELCASTLEDTATDNLRALKRYRLETIEQTEITQMDITSAWITTNRETLARECRAVAIAIKTPFELYFAMGVHRHNRRPRIPELPADLAHRIMRMV